MSKIEHTWTLSAVADLLQDDKNVEQIMALAEKRHPWIDSDDASKMFDVIADWLRSRS